MYKKPIASWLKHLDFIIIDVLCLILAFVISYYIRFNKLLWQENTNAIYYNILIVLSVSQIAISLIIHTHNNILRRNKLREISSSFNLAFFNLVFASLYMFSLKIGVEYSRLLIYWTFLIFWILDAICRNIWKYIIVNNKWQFNFLRDKRKILILTTKEHINDIIKNIIQDKFSENDIKCISLIDAENEKEIENEIFKINNFDLDAVKVISYNKLVDYVVREWIDEAFIYLPNYETEKNTFLKQCEDMALTSHIILDTKTINENKSFVESICNYTVLTNANNTITLFQMFVKRLIDVCISIIGIIFTIILYITIGPIIKLQSKGPIIYKQKRVGRNGKIFTLYKFRSMHVDADKIKQDYENKNKMDGYMFKLDFDPRIIGNEILEDGTKKTGIGQFIRKTSLDEFPQFINVLIGDMSVVGTRPPTIDEWNKYKYHHRARLSWKPGITGLWQVSGRNQITNFEDVVDLDTKYILNYKLSTDIKIILKTIVEVFKSNAS